MSFWAFLGTTLLNSSTSGQDGSNLGVTSTTTGSGFESMGMSLNTKLTDFATNFLNKTVFAVLQSGDFSCWGGAYTDATAQAGFQPVVEKINEESGLEQSFQSGDINRILSSMTTFDNMLRRGIYEARELSSSSGHYVAGWRSGCSKSSFNTMMQLLSNYRSEVMPKMLGQLTQLGIKYKTTTKKVEPQTSVIEFVYNETPDIFADYRKTGVVDKRWRWRHKPEYTEVTYTLLSMPKTETESKTTSLLKTANVNTILVLGLVGALGYGIYDSIDK